jgi:hypothetical protein
MMLFLVLSAAISGLSLAGTGCLAGSLFGLLLVSFDGE